MDVFFAIKAIPQKYVKNIFYTVELFCNFRICILTWVLYLDHWSEHNFPLWLLIQFIIFYLRLAAQIHKAYFIIMYVYRHIWNNIGYL